MRAFRVLTLSSLAATFTLISMTVASPLMANPALIGTGQISGTAVDQSGLTDTLSDGTPHNRLGGFGSGIAYNRTRGTVRGSPRSRTSRRHDAVYRSRGNSHHSRRPHRLNGLPIPE